jgi:type I restriction enzyme S subunit
VVTARAEKLTQAILVKAFRGELVPSEAELARLEGRSYEPASALLA